jgi:hypothetical protein
LFSLNLFKTCSQRNMFALDRTVSIWFVWALYCFVCVSASSH